MFKHPNPKVLLVSGVCLGGVLLSGAILASLSGILESKHRATIRVVHCELSPGPDDCYTVIQWWNGETARRPGKWGAEGGTVFAKRAWGEWR